MLDYLVWGSPVLQVYNPLAKRDVRSAACLLGVGMRHTRIPFFVASLPERGRAKSVAMERRQADIPGERQPTRLPTKSRSIFLNELTDPLNDWD